MWPPYSIELTNIQLKIVANFLSSIEKMKKVGLHLHIDNNKIEQCLTNAPNDIWTASHNMLNIWHQNADSCHQKWNQLYNALQDVLEYHDMKKLDRKIRETVETEVSFANGDEINSESKVLIQ